MSSVFNIPNISDILFFEEDDESDEDTDIEDEPNVKKENGSDLKVEQIIRMRNLGCVEYLVLFKKGWVTAQLKDRLFEGISKVIEINSDHSKYLIEWKPLWLTESTYETLCC